MKTQNIGNLITLKFWKKQGPNNLVTPVCYSKLKECPLLVIKNQQVNVSTKFTENV